MCKKKVIIPMKVEMQMMTLPKQCHKDVKILIEKNTLQNIDQRKVLENMGELDSFLEGKDVRYDAVFATLNDLVSASEQYLQQM